MHKLLAAMAVTGAALFAVPGVAAAAPGDADCRKAVIDIYLATVDEEGTRGDAISDGFFGNEPNIEPFAPGGPEQQEPGTKGGTVVPTLRPGPTTKTDDGVAVGLTWGEFQRLIDAAFCNA